MNLRLVLLTIISRRFFVLQTATPDVLMRLSLSCRSDGTVAHNGEGSNPVDLASNPEVFFFGTQHTPLSLRCNLKTFCLVPSPYRVTRARRFGSGALIPIIIPTGEKHLHSFVVFESAVEYIQPTSVHSRSRSRSRSLSHLGLRRVATMGEIKVPGCVA
jgi:hypothetical protein